MELIFKIAWRNIFRHKTKSIIIGVILFIGSFIMTLGNGVISGMNRGLEKNIVNGFMGDFVIISNKQESDNILLDMMGRVAEPINNYKQIKEALLSQKYIEKFLPAGKNAAMAISEETGTFVYLLGVDFTEYRKMFPENIHPMEGRLLNGNEKGVLVPYFTRTEYYDYTSVWFKPENDPLNEKNLSADAKENLKALKQAESIVFLGFNEGNTTQDIRLGIKGIIRYNALNQIFGHFSIMDIESYRECMGYFSASDKAVPISEEKKKILSLENQNLDLLFGSDNLIVEDTGKVNENELKVFKPAKSAPRKNIDIETGAYNVIFVKLKPGAGYNKSLTQLNKALTEANTGCRAVTWKKAAGVIGGMSTLIKTTLFVFVTFLFFVAIIIIVNTLSMAALERTSEIGMMRAVGAKKGFISVMFLSETAMLSFVFGGIGIAAGIIVVKLVPMFNLTTDNDILQMLYGGEKFYPLLSVPDILLTIAQLAIVTLIAVIYPVKIAKNITPLDAIMRD